MAITATKAVAYGSPSKGNARLVELCLADHVNEERLKAGHAAQAWPSQTTIAAWCNCSRSTVELALGKLVEIGCIADSGKRKSRGTIVWTLSLPDLTDFRSGAEGADVDLTDSGDDLTDLPLDLTDFRSPPDRPIGHEPVVTGSTEPERTSPTGLGLSPSGLEQQNSNGASAPTVVAAPPSAERVQASEEEQQQRERQEQEQHLAELREQLPSTTGSLRAATERAIERGEAELASEAAA